MPFHKFRPTGVPQRINVMDDHGPVNFGVKGRTTWYVGLDEACGRPSGSLDDCVGDCTTLGTGRGRAESRPGAPGATRVTELPSVVIAMERRRSVNGVRAQGLSAGELPPPVHPAHHPAHFALEQTPTRPSV